MARHDVGDRAAALAAICFTFLPTLADAQTVPTGKAQFQARCASCHGDDGTGRNRGPGIVNPIRPRATLAAAVRCDLNHKVAVLNHNVAADDDNAPNRSIVVSKCWRATGSRLGNMGRQPGRFCHSKRLAYRGYSGVSRLRWAKAQESHRGIQPGGFAG